MSHRCLRVNMSIQNFSFPLNPLLPSAFSLWVNDINIYLIILDGNFEVILDSAFFLSVPCGLQMGGDEQDPSDSASSLFLEFIPSLHLSLPVPYFRPLSFLALIIAPVSFLVYWLLVMSSYHPFSIPQPSCWRTNLVPSLLSLIPFRPFMTRSLFVSPAPSSHLASTFLPNCHTLASVNCFTSRGFACADTFTRNLSPTSPYLFNLREETPFGIWVWCISCCSHGTLNNISIMAFIILY